MICEFKTCLVLLSLSSLTTRSISCPASCRCDGTFIYCNDRDLTSIPAGIPEDATILYLQNNRISSANVPTGLRGLHWVEKIYLYCNNLDEFPTNLPRNVKELHLQENNIRTITCASMAQIPHIEELHLDDNSVSAVSIEEGAFRHSSHLRLLFLSRNHLSSIPLGLPGSIEELRFDDNRVSSVSEESMQDLVNLKRLILDGNLLNNRRVGEMAFVNLTNLTELSLIRNSFTAPPVNLPGSSLERLQLQDNHINAVPPGAFGCLRQLYRLDLSGNNLSSLPQGVFDDLDNLTQLLLRNNPWHCGCRMKWVRDWLHTLPSKVSVRGLMCQSPEKLKGMAIKDLATDLFDCAETQINPILQTGADPYTQPLPNGQWPPFVTRRPMVKGAGQNKLNPSFPPSGGRLISISVKSRGAETVRISWKVARPVTALRLSWLKMGQGPAFGSITETIVHGEKAEYLLTALDPESLYRICLVPMETGNIYIRDETPVCIETETGSRQTYKSSTTLNREQEKWPYKKAGLPLAPIVGGVGAFLVIVALVFVCLYVHKNRALFSRRCSYSKGRRRQDHYVEAGTKKDNSILEIRDTSFQMIPINPGIVSKEDFVIHAIFPSNGLALYKSSNGENCNQIFRDSGIQDSDHCHS